MPAALSGDATTAQDGSDFQAGGPDGSVKASSETGRWVAAITAACSTGRSAANTSCSLAGSIANSVAVPAASAVGYCRAICAVPSRLSREPAATSPKRSPSSGANAATKTSPTTLRSSVAAFEITAPAYEWPTASTGPRTCLMKLARYAESWEMPRKGLGGAVTWMPAAWSRSMTPFQLDESANAPWTRTAVSAALRLPLT